MSNTWGKELYYIPEYWTFWLKIGAALVLLTIAGIVIHAALRAVFGKKAKKIKVHRSYLHTVPVRIWHCLNALLFVTLLTTGFLNYFNIIGPNEFMVKMHALLGKFYVVLWVLFIVMGIVSGYIKNYITKLNGIVERVCNQAYYYILGIMKGDSHPYSVTMSNKFNPIQQISYIGVMFALVPLILCSGLVAQHAKSACMLKGHIYMGVVGLIFVLVHLYMCTTGDKPLHLFKSMVDGYHRENS